MGFLIPCLFALNQEQYTLRTLDISPEDVTIACCLRFVALTSCCCAETKTGMCSLIVLLPRCTCHAVQIHATYIPLIQSESQFRNTPPQLRLELGHHLLAVGRPECLVLLHATYAHVHGNWWRPYSVRSRLSLFLFFHNEARVGMPRRQN